MVRLLLLIFFCCGATLLGFTQPPADSLTKAKADSLSAAVYAKSLKNDLLTQKILAGHPYFGLTQPAVYPAYTKKIPTPGREVFFYIVTAILLLFALFRSAFDKYFTDLVNLFFRRSLKQRQLKKQVIQNALPSLLFNIFFVVTAGFFAALAIEKTTPALKLPFWQLFIYGSIGISLIYLIKYFILKFLGWVFKINKLIENYIFVIFLVNKVWAMLVLPLAIIIALTDQQIRTIAWTLSWILLAGLILYRYGSAITLIRKEKGINFFHFILYSGAFEILPTIILFKGIEALLK